MSKNQHDGESPAAALPADCLPSDRSEELLLEALRTTKGERSPKELLDKAERSADRRKVKFERDVALAYLRKLAEQKVVSSQGGYRSFGMPVYELDDRFRA